MADPLSVLGLGFGAVSLILQITDECIKGYKYFIEAAHMSESYRHLRTVIQIEQQRFLAFAMAAGLLCEEGKLCATLQVNRELLLDALTEVNTLFKEYEEKNGKYEYIVGKSNVVWDDEGEPQTNLMDLLCINPRNATPIRAKDEDKERPSLPRGFGRLRSRTTAAACRLRTIITQPRRLIWVSFDKEVFEALISKLRELNSFLLGLLSAAEAKDLKKLVEMNYLELLQQRQDIESLKTLVRALDWDATSSRQAPNQLSPDPCRYPNVEAAIKGRQVDEGEKRYLRSLARVKVRHIEIDQLQDGETSPTSGTCTTAMSLNLSSFRFTRNSFGIYERERRPTASWNGCDVWIEWVERRPYKAMPLREERVMRLTKLLCDGVPPAFRAPRCLGYIKHPTYERGVDFGMVFEKPSGIGGEPVLTTLRQSLGTLPKPTITTRVSLCSALAGCLFSLHAVDWTHKGLRSDNILFLGTGVTGLTLEEPYVTGYDLSRPSDIPEMTEEPPCDPRYDVYRHPYAQSGEARSRYRKSYDMYSLGIILLEIALWKPIEDVLGIDNLAATKPNDLRNVRKKLLGLPENDIGIGGTTPTALDSEYLRGAARKFGDSYCHVVEMCLSADEVEKPTYRGESPMSISFRLRTMFKEQVIEKLELMKEALRG